jgi:hypothetical protein
VHAPTLLDIGEMSAASDCPRWQKKVRFPASDDDRRGVFEIPTAMVASMTTGSSITMLVDPDDPSVGVAHDLLNAAEVAGNEVPVILHLCGHTFWLNKKEVKSGRRSLVGLAQRIDWSGLRCASCCSWMRKSP